MGRSKHTHEDWRCYLKIVVIVRSWLCCTAVLPPCRRWAMKSIRCGEDAMGMQRPLLQLAISELTGGRVNAHIVGRFNSSSSPNRGGRRRPAGEIDLTFLFFGRRSHCFLSYFRAISLLVFLDVLALSLFWSLWVVIYLDSFSSGRISIN